MFESLQDFILVRVDNRELQHGKVPCHLSPSLLAHHVWVQESPEDYRHGMASLSASCVAIRFLHQTSLHRPASQLGKPRSRISILCTPRG